MKTSAIIPEEFIMPVRAKIIPEYNLVYIRYSGFVTLADVQRSQQETYSHPCYRVGMCEIDDLRAITHVDIKFRDMLNYVSELLSHHKEMGETPKVALIESGPLVYGLARMFTSLVDVKGNELDVKIVDSDKSACAFLGLPDLSLASLAAQA